MSADPSQRARRRGIGFFVAAIALLVLQVALRLNFGMDNPLDAPLSLLSLLGIAFGYREWGWAHGYQAGRRESSDG
jgi:hypothetical protein